MIMDNKPTYTGVIIGSNGLTGSGHKEISYKVKLLGIDISGLSQTTQFIVVSSGVLIFFILYGYVLEAIFIQPSIKSHGLYLTFFQFILYSVFAFVECRLSGHTVRRIPIPTYNAISFLTVSTMALSNTSLEYLNYPTQVIFKSCKLIPVLVGGILIQGKKYGPNDFIAAAIMCIGLIWFTLVDVTISPNFHPTGIVMINFALVADAVIGNVQEKAMKKYGASNSEVVLYSYSIGIAYLGVALIATGRLIPAIQASQQYPFEFYGYGFLLSLTGYLGVNLVLTLVRVAGAFAAVAVTTCRKALSITVSFLAFSKPFSMQYIWSGMLVLLGVHLNLVSKKNEKFIFDWMNYRAVDLWIRGIYRTVRSSKVINQILQKNKLKVSKNRNVISV